VSDFAAFQVASPLNSEAVTIYNLNPAKQGLVDLLDTTADRSKARFSFTGVELTLRARLPNGASMYGGWSGGQAITVACANFSDPNTFRYCDHSELDIPYRHSLKFSGSYPLPLGVVFGASAVSNAGHILGSNVPDGSLNVNWAVPANLFPGGRTRPVTVRLIPPGSQYLERWSQLDVQVKRVFSIGNARVEPGVDLYNVFNSNAVLVQNQNFGSALGQAQRVLQGRLLRFTAQIIF